MSLPGTQRAGVAGEVSSVHHSWGPALLTPKSETLRRCQPWCRVAMTHQCPPLSPHEPRPISVPLMALRHPCSLATSTPGGTASTREDSWDLGPSLLPASRQSLLELQELSAGLLASLSHRCSSEEQQTKTKLFCVCKLSPETGVWQP